MPVFLLVIGKAYGLWANSKNVLYRWWVRPPSSREASLTKPLIDTKSITAALPLSSYSRYLSGIAGAQTLNKEEVWAVELACEVSKATAQHTHLPSPGTWWRMEKEAKPARLFLSKDFTLLPNSVYREVCSWWCVRRLLWDHYLQAVHGEAPALGPRVSCSVRQLNDSGSWWNLTSTHVKADRSNNPQGPAAGNYLLRNFISMLVVGIWGISFCFFGGFSPFFGFWSTCLYGS